MASVLTTQSGNQVIKSVLLRNPSGETFQAHIQRQEDRASTYPDLGSVGLKLAQIVPLEGPTYDGAKSVVKIKVRKPLYMSYSHEETKRSKDSVEEVLSVLNEARLQTTLRVRPQSRASKLFQPGYERCSRSCRAEPSISKVTAGRIAAVHQKFDEGSLRIDIFNARTHFRRLKG